MRVFRRRRVTTRLLCVVALLPVVSVAVPDEEVRWALTEFFVGERSQIVACALFFEDEQVCAAVVRGACAGSADPTQCEEAVGARTRQGAVGTGGDVELAMATMWPAVIEGLLGSRVPLLYVTADNAGLPRDSRVCIAVAIQKGAQFHTECERTHGEFQVRADLDYDEGRLGKLHLEDLEIVNYLTLLTPGLTSVLAYVVQAGRLVQGSSVVTLHVGAAAEINEPNRFLERYHGSDDPGRSSVLITDVPGFPHPARNSVARRVVYDSQEDTLILFADVTMPRVLGRLRNAAVVGGWRKIRVVNASYAEFKCDRIPRIQSTRLLQPAHNNQYHFLFTAYSALLASSPSGVILLDDAMDARLIFDGGHMAARVEALLLAAFDDARLWPGYFKTRYTCIEELAVGQDERDSLHAFTHLSHGLILPHFNFPAPANSAMRRSSEALLAMREKLRLTFAVNYSAHVFRVTLIIRRGSRRFGDPESVLAALRAGCDECQVTTIVFEDKTFDEQLAVLAETDVLVGVEGQGLANMLYIPDDAAVVILVPEAFPKAANDYTNIATLLGLTVATTLLLTEPTRLGFFNSLDYWSPANDVLEFPPDKVTAALASAVRRRREQQNRQNHR